MFYQNVLDRMTKRSKEIFGGNLTGVYLHGSMAMGCFNPEKSDIDLLNVVEDDITDERKLEFMKEVVVILSILVYTLFSRMFDLMQRPVVNHSIVGA